MKQKKFNFNNSVSRGLIGMGLAYAPSLSNSAASIFCSYSVASFLAEIGYPISGADIANITPTRKTIANLIESSAIDAMLDIVDDIQDPNVKIHLATDHGNKKGMHHLVKVISY